MEMGNNFKLHFQPKLSLPGEQDKFNFDTLQLKLFTFYFSLTYIYLGQNISELR